MPPMLVIKRKMCIIKQLCKKDNAHQKPFNITQLFKNNNLKNVIKNIFNVNLHHDATKV